MQEVDADAILVGVELRESVEPGFDSATVVIARPVFADFLHVLEGNPLRRIRNGLQVGPARGAQALFQILEIRIADMNLEPLDFVAHGLLLRIHKDWAREARSAPAGSQFPFQGCSATLEPTSHVRRCKRSRQCWLGAYGAFCMMRTSIDSVTAIPTVSPVSSLMRREGPSKRTLFGLS